MKVVAKTHILKLMSSEYMSFPRGHYRFLNDLFMSIETHWETYY